MPELSLHLEDMHPAFVRDVMKPLQIEQLLNRKVESLSPGETQRVALTICLGSVSNIQFTIIKIKSLTTLVTYLKNLFLTARKCLPDR